MAKNFASTHSAFGPAILITVRPWERSVTVPVDGVTLFVKVGGKSLVLIGDEKFSRREAESGLRLSRYAAARAIGQRQSGRPP